jgi:hypothetical protein
MKPFWASKTLWVNFIALAASASVAMGLDLGLTAESQAEIVGGVMATVNIALRLVTKTPVK